MYRSGIPMVLLVFLILMVPAIAQDSIGPVQLDERHAQERIAALEYQVEQLQDKLEALSENRARQHEKRASTRP